MIVTRNTIEAPKTLPPIACAIEQLALHEDIDELASLTEMQAQLLTQLMALAKERGSLAVRKLMAGVNAKTVMDVAPADIPRLHAAIEETRQGETVQ